MGDRAAGTAACLVELYGEEAGRAAAGRLHSIVEAHRGTIPAPRQKEVAWLRTATGQS